jgi:hypothetical protein
VCHIRAQNVGGPRYLTSQTDDQRHGFDNLILMCGNHHKEIDAAANLGLYTETWLFEAKRVHENAGRAAGEIAAPPDLITALVWTVTVYERAPRTWTSATPCSRSAARAAAHWVAAARAVC